MRPPPDNKYYPYSCKVLEVEFGYACRGLCGADTEQYSSEEPADVPPAVPGTFEPTSMHSFMEACP
jgi:hypothetical protein